MFKAEYNVEDVVWVTNGKWSWWPASIKAIHNENDKWFATINLIERNIEKTVPCSRLRSYDGKAIKRKRKRENDILISKAIATANKMLQRLPIMEGKFKVNLVREEGGKKEEP